MPSLSVVCRSKLYNWYENCNKAEMLRHLFQEMFSTDTDSNWTLSLGKGLQVLSCNMPLAIFGWIVKTPHKFCHQFDCKSLLCSLFDKQTCTRFTWLVGCCRHHAWNTLWLPYNAIFLKSPRSKDIKTDIPNCQIHKYTNTQIQIHKYKYTNTNIQIQIHKYKYTNTNTQIQVPLREI